jgi:hypothetical protein
MLTLQDSAVSGTAIGGGGGNGGSAAAGGSGGYGGNGGVVTMNAVGATFGNGGNGGDGGNGGAGGSGGNGGSAVGGILNDGTINVVGAAILHDDSATAGAGGDGGDGGAGNPGGALGTAGGPGALNGLNGADGEEGETGANGVSGSAYADLDGAAAASGTLTIGGLLFTFIGQPATATFNTFSDTMVSLEYHVFCAGTNGASGSVEWKVVTGADGPNLSDFLSPTSGTIDVNDTFGGNFAYGMGLTLEADPTRPAVESFSIELSNPSTGDILGSLTSITQTVVNSAITLKPVVAIDSTPAFFNGVDPTIIAGTVSEVGGSVAGLEIFNGTANLGAATLNGDGTWSFTDPLPTGSYNALKAVATDAGGKTASANASFRLATGITGQSYASEELDYSTNGALIDSKYFFSDGAEEVLRSNIVGEPYTSEQQDYDSSGNLSKALFTGNGQAYSTLEEDYSAGVYTGDKATYTGIIRFPSD